MTGVVDAEHHHRRRFAGIGLALEFGQLLGRELQRRNHSRLCCSRSRSRRRCGRHDCRVAHLRRAARLSFRIGDDKALADQLHPPVRLEFHRAYSRNRGLDPHLVARPRHGAGRQIDPYLAVGFDLGNFAAQIRRVRQADKPAGGEHGQQSEARWKVA